METVKEKLIDVDRIKIPTGGVQDYEEKTLFETREY